MMGAIHDTMSKLAEKIGSLSATYHDHAHQDNVKAFAEGLGLSTMPQSLPPTYLTRCRRGEFELFNQLGIPLSQVLHADQEYEFFTEINIGDKLSYQTEFTHFNHKSGSSAALYFLTFETRLNRNAEAQASALARTVIVVRLGVTQ